MYVHTLVPTYPIPYPLPYAHTHTCLGRARLCSVDQVWLVWSRSVSVDWFEVNRFEVDGSSVRGLTPRSAGAAQHGTLSLTRAQRPSMGP